MISSPWSWIDPTSLAKIRPGQRAIRRQYGNSYRSSPSRLACLLLVLNLASHGYAHAGNPFSEWAHRLFGGHADSARVGLAPAQGVVVLDLDRPERIRVGPDSEQREFPGGRSRYRELELPREYDHVAVRLQVISRPNPVGRGNAVFKPVLYVLDDDGSIRESVDVDPLQIDIRPFKPTRLLACIPVENVRRLAVATPAAAVGQYFQSKPRDKIKAPSKDGFYYETNSIKSNLPYIETGELIVEVARAGRKGEGC